MVTSVAIAPGVGAQEPEPFVPGEATATANTVTLGLSLGGGKPIEVGLGKALARYQNRSATSQGTALSLGLLELFLGPSSQCGELPPPIPAEQLPPITTGDSRREVVQTPTEVRSPGTATEPGGVLGTQTAFATAEPQRSDAQTTTVSQDFGVIALDGGTTEVTTSLAGTVREARAVTTGTRLRVLGDVFVINNPRWEAISRTGSITTAEGRFTFDSATILGMDRPAEAFKGDFMSLAGGISQLLGFLGLKIQYPEVIVDEFGLVTVTPLTVGVENPPIGIDFIKPLLGMLAPYKDEEWAKLIDEDCNNAGLLQLADIALGVLGGTGSATLNVGGVTAFSAATVFPEAPEIDFGNIDLAPELDMAPIEIAPIEPIAPLAIETPPSFNASVLGDSDYSSSLSDVGPAIVPEPPPGVVPDTATPTTGAPTVDLPSANVAASTLLPGKKGGPALVVGLAGIGGLLALAGSDRFVMRRTRREIGD